MISYLGSLVQFSPAAGRAGCCRQLSLCVGSASRVLAGQPEAWRSLHWCAAPPPSAVPARARSGLRKSSDRNRGLFAGWEGVASLGLSLPLSPPPASYPQRGWGGSSLEFLSPFVLRTAGGVFRPVNFSLALPHFKKSSLDCSQGLLAGPYPKECRRLISVPPPLAGGGCGRLGYFSAGSCFQGRNLWVLFNFSSQLGPSFFCVPF